MNFNLGDYRHSLTHVTFAVLELLSLAAKKNNGLFYKVVFDFIVKVPELGLTIITRRNTFRLNANDRQNIH